MGVIFEEVANDGRTWYRIRGREYGTQYDLDDIYGVDPDGASDDEQPCIIDRDGTPLTGGYELIAVSNVLRRGIVALENLE